MIGSLEQLVAVMSSHGATRFYAKELAPNDNSKNQIYLGGDFSALNVIPFAAVHTDSSTMAGSLRDRAKAAVKFRWVDVDGAFPAPRAQLILYPSYPEVRLSSLLAGCSRAPSGLIASRDLGRVLFLGVTEAGEVLGYASQADDPVARELRTRGDWETIGVFLEIPASLDASSDTRSRLLRELRRVHEQGWIQSKMLLPSGETAPYNGSNGGGYTLEAELGISPNGYAQPDFAGWEIKQYGVDDFTTLRPRSPVTLLTPEPTGGIYRERGVVEFVRRFGYPDQSGIMDRMNFGGIYAFGGAFHARTGLRLVLIGYDSVTGKIEDMNGAVVLSSRHGEVAASWSFIGLMEHWNRKHAQAAYIPSISQASPPAYAFGPKVLLCEHTDFLLFLGAMSSGVIYYDPGIKVERMSTSSPRPKRRSQFRTRHANLGVLYQQTELVRLLGPDEAVKVNH